jgi:sulfur relay (sulfurtransferase) DsrC/TusE family protein
MLFCLNLNLIFCDESDNIFNTEISKKIYSSMGFDEKETLTREEFKVFFYRMITRDREQVNNGPFFEQVSRILADDVPEKFEVINMIDYMTQESIIESIVKVIKEFYGEQYVEPAKNQFKMLFKDMPSKKGKGKQKDHETQKTSDEL